MTQADTEQLLYSSTHSLATMCRLAVGASIALGYPLTFTTRTHFLNKSVCLIRCMRLPCNLAYCLLRLILNNYSNGDKLATMCRLAIGASIVFGYPLTFITTREGVFSALNITNPTQKQVRCLLVLLVVHDLLCCVCLQYTHTHDCNAYSYMLWPLEVCSNL